MPGNFTSPSLLFPLTIWFSVCLFWRQFLLETLYTPGQPETHFAELAGFKRIEIFHCCLPQATKPCLNCLFGFCVGLIHMYHQSNISQTHFYKFSSCFLSISVSGSCNLAVVAKSNVVHLHSLLPSLPFLFPSLLPPPFLPALFSSISPSLSYLPHFFCLFTHSLVILSLRQSLITSPRLVSNSWHFCPRLPSLKITVSPGLGKTNHLSTPFSHFTFKSNKFFRLCRECTSRTCPLLPSTALAHGKPSVFLNCCSWWALPLFFFFFKQFQCIVMEQPGRSLSASITQILLSP